MDSDHTYDRKALNKEARRSLDKVAPLDVVRVERLSVRRALGGKGLSGVKLPVVDGRSPPAR